MAGDLVPQTRPAGRQLCKMMSWTLVGPGPESHRLMSFICVESRCGLNGRIRIAQTASERKRFAKSDGKERMTEIVVTATEKIAKRN
jgi:hypothetical protein